MGGIFAATTARGLIRDKDRGNDYGDWLSIGADTPKDLIGTAYFAYSTHLAGRILSRRWHARRKPAKYEQLFEDIKAAFNKHYVAADGRIQGNTQCAYAMALKFDLLPENLRPKAAQYLEEDIQAKGEHLSTGFVGVSCLLPVLTLEGRPISPISCSCRTLSRRGCFPSSTAPPPSGSAGTGGLPKRDFRTPA